MNEKQNYQALQRTAFAEGITLFGVADVRDINKDFLIPPETAEQLPFAVSMGIRLSRSILRTIVDAPNQSYYFHYQRVNILLDQTAIKITSAIQKEGFDAYPVPASQISDWDKQHGALSHREIARRAGLGWYGRNNLLVNEFHGAQVRYATVLTDMPLPADKPVPGGCGDCRACVSVCPAGAIKDDGFDRETCHMKLKEFTKTQKIGHMICGVCVKACGGKVSAIKRHE
jgi:Uncharacterized Fe-S protein